ncbi:MAG: hypothetical protein HOP22_11405 [Nitrospiraceae bacterium]|nr:hypothetical protein [Nitrospiraceae bacterium]
MLMFFLLSLIASYAVGMVRPFCFLRQPQTQGVVGSVSVCVASVFGIVLGITWLVASEPLTASIGSAIPFLAFAVRLDPLLSFFVLTLSLAGLAASIYAVRFSRGAVNLSRIGLIFYLGPGTSTFGCAPCRAGG